MSDWLTKTIAGVGLTQLYFIPGYVWRSAAKMNTFGVHWPESGQGFVALIAVYYGSGGFWLGYVGTRTILTMLFDKVDSAEAGRANDPLDPSNIQLDLDGTSIAQAATPARARADERLLAPL